MHLLTGFKNGKIYSTVPLKDSLTTQTSNALVITLQSTSSLFEDLLFEGHSYVLTSRFQSDPLERPFSMYRQMSGGR